MHRSCFPADKGLSPLPESDQPGEFSTRGGYQPVRQLSPPRNSSTIDDSTERPPAYLAGRTLPERPPAYLAGRTFPEVPQHLLPRSASTTRTNAHPSSKAVPTFPAYLAGEKVLASSPSQAPVNWHSLGKKPARTEQQDASRPAEGSLDTYEDRTLEIMQQIWNLSDGYDRMHAEASRLQPYPEDNYQRLIQLYTSVRKHIDELRHDCTQYTVVMGDWDVLATEHLSEDSEWSRKMLQHRRSFFEDPAFIPKLLDEKQMDLLDYYCRTQQRIEDIISDRDTAHSRGDPTYLVGNHRVLSATEQQSAAIRLGTQPPPTDTSNRTRTAVPDASRPRNILGETLPPPIPLGWSTARGRARQIPQRPAAYLAVGTAPSPGPAAYLAVGNLGGSGSQPATAYPAQDRAKTTMSTCIPPVAAGRGPISSSSAPLHVGADGKPLSRSTANAAQPTSAQGAADFGPENTSAFYRNATYHRSTSGNLPPPFILKAPLVTPFDGDIRTYPTFRNQFLEIIEAQPGLEPRHKLQHLLQYLRGEPHLTASRYMITDSNYFKVLDHLEGRYGSKANLCMHLMGLLLSLPAPTTAAQDLRRFHDDSAQLIAEFSQTGEDLSTNCMLLQQLLAKLPQTVRLEVIRRADHDLPTAPILLEKLHNYVRLLEAAEIATSWDTRGQTGLPCRGDPRDPPRDQPSTSRQQHYRYNNFMAEAEIIVAQCPLCSGPHWPSQCTRYDTAKTRMRRAQKLHFCFLCLKGSHRGGPCPKKTGEPCQRCGRGEHHRALCKDLPRRRKEIQPDPMRAQKTEQATPQAPAGGPATATPRAERSKPKSPTRPVLPDYSVIRPKPTSNGQSTVEPSRLPSAHLSPTQGRDNSTNTETKPSQETRTDPEELKGTTSSTAEIAERSIVSKGGYASGPAEFLLARKNLRSTERRSPRDEMVQFGRKNGSGSRRENGISDRIMEPYALHAIEDVSPQQPSGQLNDGEIGQPITEPTPRFATEHHHEDNAIIPLLERITDSKASTSSWSSKSFFTAPGSNGGGASPLPDHSTTPSLMEPPTSRLQLWLQDLSTDQPAYLAGSQEDSSPDARACLPTYLVGDTVLYTVTEFLEPSPSTTISSGQPPAQSRVPDALPPAPQKQLHSNPLDTQPLLLPTTTTNVEVKDVSAAYLAVGLPRPIQDPSSSTEAEIRCSLLPTPTQGNQICAPLCDAGSTLKRKTRLRCRLLELAQQILGIYTAPEPVSSIVLRISMDSSVLFLLRADRDTQLVMTPPLPRRPIRLPLSIVQCFIVLQCSAVLSPASFDAVLVGFLLLARQRPTAIQWTPPLEAPGSQRDRLHVELRSKRGPQTHARGPAGQQVPDSAHQQPPARNAHTTEDAPQRPGTSQQPTPQSVTSWPTGPPPARLPALPHSTRVRIDPRPAAATHGPEDAINHSTQRLSAPAARVVFSSRISQCTVACASRVSSALARIKPCLTRLISAPPQATMGRRKNKDKYSDPADEYFEDDCPHVITEADGTRRALTAGEIERAVVGEELAEELATNVTLRQQMNPDDDEPLDTGHGASRPAYLAGREASQTVGAASSAAPSVPPTYLVGAGGEAQRASQPPSSGRAAKASTSSKSSTPSDPRKPKDRSSSRTTTKTKPSVQDRLGKEFTAADLASMKLRYTIEQAQQQIAVVPSARTIADFRQELAHFYDNWRDLNKKTEGSGPKAWTEPWKTNKLGKILYRRYKTHRAIVKQRQEEDQRSLTTTATTETITEMEITTSSSAQSTTQTTTVTSTQSTDVTSTSATTSKTDAVDTSEAMDTSTVFSNLQLSAKELDQYLGKSTDDPIDVDREGAQAAEDLLSDKFEDLLDEDILEEETPATQLALPTYLVGTQGGDGAGAAYLAVPATGTVGDAAQVPSGPPAPQQDRQAAATPSERLSPGIDRHRTRRAKDDRLLSPIIDPRVFKDSAVALNIQGVEFTPWLDDFSHVQREFLGFINAYQAPWTYLQPGQYADKPQYRAAHALANVDLKAVLQETRLPNQHLLGNTFGIDPWLWKMVTEETARQLHYIAEQKYWEPISGQPLRVLGVGPTGFDLSNCTDYQVTYHGQRNALMCHARAANNAAKCLSLIVAKHAGAGNLDIHQATRDALREAGLVSHHPIHLQGFVANYEDLCGWLEQFPNTVIAFDYRLLDNYVEIEEQLRNTPDNVHYAPIVGMLVFLKFVPLNNFAVQSAAYNRNGQRVLRHPSDIMAAVSLLERTVGTAQDTYLERTAANMVRIYQLQPELLDRARSTPDQGTPPRVSIAHLRHTIYAELVRRGLAQAPQGPPPPPPPPPPAPAVAAAPRADPTPSDPDQNKNDHRSPPGPTAYLAGDSAGVASGEAHIVPSVPPPEASKDKHRSGDKAKKAKRPRRPGPARAALQAF